jgi:hypothetical protein
MAEVAFWHSQFTVAHTAVALLIKSQGCSPSRIVHSDIVVSEALEGGRGKEAFYSTCHDASAEQVIQWYAMPWSVEVAFRDSKQFLGFEELQGWSRRAVERTAPLAMLLYSLVVIWFAKEGHRSCRLPNHRWYPGKQEPCFADMLRTLRQESARKQVLAIPPTGPGSRKLTQLLEHAIRMAT